jgi:MFS family permease
VAVLVACVHGNVHALEHIFPVVLPLLIVEFHGSVALFGAIGTAAYLTMGLGGLPAGYLADRLGSQRSLMLGTGLCAAGCLAVAASPDAGLVAASLAILGVGLGLYHPAGLSLLSRTYRGFHGWSLGIHGVGGAAAIVISPALFGAIAALAGWRVAYVVAGVLSLLLVAMLLVFGKRGEVVRSREPALEVAAGRTSWPLIVLLMVETACTGLVYRGVVTFMPMFYAGEVAPVLPGAVARLLASGGAGSSAALAAAIGGSPRSRTWAPSSARRWEAGPRARGRSRPGFSASAPCSPARSSAWASPTASPSSPSACSSPASTSPRSPSRT